MAGNTELVLERLDALALQLAMMDADLSDLKIVVELSQRVDEIKGLLVGEEPSELALMFSGLSQTFEKFIMGQVPASTAATALELVGEAINLSRDGFSKNFDKDNLAPRVTKFVATLKEVFDVVPEKPAAPPPPKVEKAAEPTAAPATAATAPSHGDVPVSKLVLMDDNDVIIFEGFLDESTDMVNKIEEYVMALEENPNNTDIINSLFRVFHSLKGAAGFLGMNEINTLCHDAENLLDNIRKGKMKVDRECSDIVMAVRDTLEKGLASVSETLTTGKANLPNFSGEIKRLHIGPILDLIDRKLFGAPAEGDGPPKLGELLVEKRIVTADQLQVALDQRDKPLGQILVDMGAATKINIDAVVQEQQAKKPAAVAAAIKVDTKKLNTLLELVGELVIAQAIISQSSSLKEESNQKLSKEVVEMAKITNGIQDHIMSLRMVPMHQTFQKMNRLVRDLSRKTGKQVNFVMHGEETEIDKTIVEQLNDPLVHLLRNAVDHGVESAEDREAQGKSPEGVITLAAYHKGGNVIIEVRDDGKGLNLEKIKNLAIEKGLIDKNGTYTEDDIRNIIFLPGFSTHKVATDLSGRGVGMDVVRRNVEQLGGKVVLLSVPGKGSTFQIKLPLTMAIVDGMLVRVGGERYIIPTIAISESIKPKAEQLSTVVERGEVMNVRGELIPLVRLHELFGIDHTRRDVTEGLVIIVGTEKEHRGLMVDDLLGQQQVVIKNLDKRFHGIQGFSGSSILGDGLVGLILDVAGVFELASN